jgi:carbon storage regulator CsrA
MRIFGCRKGDVVHLGPDIHIEIESVGRVNVRMRILAPRDITIFRQELAEKKELEARETLHEN